MLAQGRRRKVRVHPSPSSGTGEPTSGIPAIMTEEGESQSVLIDRRIAQVGGGRGQAQARMRALIREGEEVDAAAFKALVREAVALNVARRR